MEFEQVKSPRLGVYVVKLTLKVSVFIFSHRQGHRHPSLEKVVFFFYCCCLGLLLMWRLVVLMKKGIERM